MGNDDFVRVPKEPTPEMIDAGVRSRDGGDGLFLMWQEMLSAAPPSAPSGEPVAWMYSMNGADAVHLDRKRLPDIVGPLWSETPLYAAPSGDNVSAASEAPISAEAVKSNDVAEMVERLQFLLDRIGELEMPDDENFMRDWMGHVEPAIARARSALPHPDTKRT